jgi:tetratricopeptide (TPR) repeat protein
VGRTRRATRRAALAAGALALVVAGLAAAWASSGGGGDTRTVVVTRTSTTTTTVRADPTVETVTVQTPTQSTPSGAGRSGASLNDDGFRLLRAGDYEAALPLLEQAVARLSGTGGLAEAYASYNLALTRFALGRCDDVLELLQRSEEVQGARKEIDRLRKRVDRTCGGRGGHGQDKR